MNKRIYVAVFGSGLGHITRMMPIVEHFQTLGADFEFSSFNEALRYISEKGYKCNVVPRIDAVFDSSGKVSSSGTVKAVPMDFVYFARQVLLEIHNMQNFRPNLVLSDSRLSTVVASEYLGIPSISILNQIKILLPRMYGRRVAPVFERIDGEILGVFWSWSKEILLPDLPPPHSISDWGLWGVWSASKAKYIGFMIEIPKVLDAEKGLRTVGLNPDKPIAFFQISGPSESKQSLVNLALGASKTMNEDIQTVISYGNPSGSARPYRQNGALIFEWCPIKNELFAACDVVVARSGHSTIGQSILYGKPIVAVPITDHTEQLRNAQRVEELGFGVSLREDEAKDSIASAIVNTVADSSFSEKALFLKEIALKYDGLKTCKTIVARYLSGEGN